MSKERRDKSKDTQPGGPDQRLDRVEWLIEKGRIFEAGQLLDRTERELDETDSCLKKEHRVPPLRRRIWEVHRGGRDVIADAAERVLREPLPGGSQSKFTEEEWARIDAVAKQMVYPRLEKGEDSDEVANDVIDTLGEIYGIPIGTSKDRKRLVRKVKDHVDRWVERHAA